MLQALGILGGIGIYFAVVMGLCIFAGDWLDQNYGLGYYGKLTGIIVGFPIAIYSTWRQLKKNQF